MVTAGFGVCLVISILATLLIALRNDNRISSYDWSISLLLPVWLTFREGIPDDMIPDHGHRGRLFHPHARGLRHLPFGGQDLRL